MIKKSLSVALFASSILYFVACSSHYTLPSESKVVINKEKLAQYNPKIFSTQKEVASVKGEDQLIIKAIWLEQQQNFRESHKIYAELYRLTKNDEYLLKELTTAHYAGLLSKNLDALKSYIEEHPNNLQAKRLMLSFLLKENKFEKAKNIAESLAQKSTRAIDFELIATPYIFTKDYNNALKYLNKAYNKTFHTDLLLKIITIEINYLHNVDRAVEKLENHINSQGCNEEICLQLIAIYTQQNRTDKIIEIYQKLIQSTHKKIYIDKLIESYLYHKDIDGAINYLKEHSLNDELLYSLYMEQKSYSKAYNLTHQLLLKTKEPKWYAESAIAQFESLQDKNDRKALDEIVNKFQKAFSQGVKNSVYLNFYAYTLIDKDIDVKKGIDILKSIIEEEPENTYYLDSLAWGEYKLDNCEEAYSIMKKVVDIEGLEEEEISQHWHTISAKCKRD